MLVEYYPSKRLEEKE